MVGDRFQAFATVARLGDDLDVRCAAEDHREPRAYESVVVDDEDLDHGEHGSQARSSNSPRLLMRCRNDPPLSSARSLSPMSPSPAPGVVAERPTRSGLRISRCTAVSSRPSSTVTFAWGACLRALVSASWSLR